MKMVFEDSALEELYVNGTTTHSQYRKLAKDVVKQYVKVVNYIRAARRIEDLYCIKRDCRGYYSCARPQSAQRDCTQVRLGFAINIFF